MTSTKKFLSLVLSFVMVFTVLNVAFVAFAPTVYAAPPTSGDYDDLAALIRTLRTNGNNDNLTVGGSNNSLTAVYNDSTGDMIAVVEKYYAIFNGLRPTGTIATNTANRTATMINDTITNQMQSRFTSDELGTWQVVSLLKSMIANANVSGGENTTQNQITIPSITVTVNNKQALFAYDSLDTLPDSVEQGVKYTVTHNRGTRVESGCTTTTYYFAKINSFDSDAAGDISTAAIKALNGKITDYADYYAADFATLVATDTDTLETVKADLSAAYNAVINSTAFDGAAVYTHFFTADTAGLLAQIDAAIAIATYIGIAQELQAYTETDITEYTFEDLSDLYFEMQGKLDNYNDSCPAATKAFLEENGYIDMGAVNAKFEEIENAYELAYLRDTLKPRIEADLETYAAYDDDWTIATDGVEGILAAAELEVDTVMALMAGKKLANVLTVFGEIEDVEMENIATIADYVAAYKEANFQPILDGFARIREVNDYNLTFKGYQNVFLSVFEPLTLEETDAQLLNILNQRDAWYTELQAFAAELAEYDAELAEKILTDAEAAMEDKIDRTYAALNAILETQIDAAWAIYQTQEDEQGLLINEVNMSTYNTLMQSVGLINVNVYNFLDDTVHFDLSEETIEKYEALKNIVIALNNYDPSQHLSAYKYNKETLDPIIRYVNDGDIIRDRDFVVTDEYFQELIDLLDDLLVNGGLSELGMDLDLAATLDGLADTVYTDKFLNTIVGAIYPMLTDLVKDKLGNLDGVGALLGYINLDDAFEKINSALTPAKLGALMKSSTRDVNNISYSARGYRNIADKLSPLSGSIMDDTNPWYSNAARAAIWEMVLDEDGNTVLDDEGEPKWELTLDWGIDAAGAELEEAGDIEGARAARKEAFLSAANAGLVGLEKAFLAMLSYRAVAKTSILNIIIASASLGVAARDGYNNAFIPIFEALGCTDLYNGRSFTNIRDIIDLGLIHPVHDLFGQLKASPVNKILELLPNLAFAIQNGLFLPLLNNLVLHLDIYLGGLAALAGDQTFDVNLGDPDTLDLADTIGVETFYDDIKSLDGVLNLVLGLLAGDEEEAEEPAEGEEPATATDAEPAPELKLPHMDGAKLAMLGTDVTWADSFRSKSQIVYEGRQNVHANIKANRPQVMQFLLEYLLEAVKDEDFIPAILHKINKDKAEDEQVVLPDMVNELIANVNASGTDAVAAIYELVHPVYRYTMPDGINWITEGTINETDYANYWTDVSAEGKETLWTKTKAVYMAEHLGDFLDDIVTIFGERLGGAQTLGQAVDYLLGDLFKASTLNDLAASLKEMLGGLELPEAIADIGLLESIGLDLTAWDDMTFDFADGDRAAFKAGLIDLLDPLAPLLGFLLAEQDINLNLLNLIDVTAVGYDGYAYGIVPLLEAFGATGVKTPSAFIADSNNVVKNLIDPVFSLIDKLEDNPLIFIEDLIPSLLYFDRMGGIQVAIQHLLTAAQVLLDIIRPIYDVDLYGIVAEKFGIDLHFAETDPINFLLLKIGDLIEENTDITLNIDFTVESLSAELNFTDPIKYTSKNGDDAYTIRLTDDGKADLVTRVLDFGLEELVFADNVANLKELLKDVITDLNLLALVTTLLDNLDMLDEDVEDFHGIKDVALTTVFWIFFGADSVTDADADFFHRFNKEEDSYIDFLLMALDSSAPYMERFGFIAEEIIKVEYPALMQALENARQLEGNPFEYTPEQAHYLSGILTRFISFFLHLYAYLKVLFGK